MNVVLKFHKEKEYMSEKTGRGCMLNTFYLWSEPVSCLPENVLFEVAGYDVCKTDAACKESVGFPMPPLTHGAWQQTEVGTGLEGQLPKPSLSPRAKGIFANLCIACALNPCNWRLAPSSFIAVIKWRDRNGVYWFLFLLFKATWLLRFNMLVASS